MRLEASLRNAWGGFANGKSYGIARCFLVLRSSSSDYYAAYRLQDTVIDLEVANHTASPTVDPSVHVFLIGHSMGGIVGAETLLLLATEQPILRESDSATQPAQHPPNEDPVVEPGSFMFPHIQGVLAFDTPFLGIAPGVMSYGAEGHYRNAATAYTAFSEVAGLFGYGGKSNGSNNEASTALPNEPNKPLPSSSDAAATPSWERWGRYAMFAGAAGAVAAGGAAAMYTQRQRISEGFSWVSSHLEFVGCLTRASDLRQRLTRLAAVQEERGIECVNFYTCLGKGATSIVENPPTSQTSFSQKIIRSKNRTFCSLPPEVEGGTETEDVPGLRWTKAVNEQANDEIKAHMAMFLPRQNPAFFELVGGACTVLVKSVDRAWYNSSSAPVEEESSATPSHVARELTPSKMNDDFMDGDDVVVLD